MDSTVESKVDSMEEHEFKNDIKRTNERYLDVALIIENNI